LGFHHAVIRASSAKQVDALVKDLASDQAIARDAATARLTVIGARAVERVAALAADRRAPATARAAALRTLEGIADHRGLNVALRALDDRDLSVATAAVGVARVFVEDPNGLAAVDRLTGVVLDRSRPEPLRLAAFRALEHLDATTLRPLREALKDDPSATLRSSGPSTAAKARGAKRLARMIEEGTLPDDPALLNQALAMSAAEAPLGGLHALLERIRERENREEQVAARSGWTAARGTVHAALAARKSLLGLYDLRESVASAQEPLPQDFVTALAVLGDASCLESIAAAYARQRGGGADSSRKGQPSSEPLAARSADQWLHQLALAFATIVTREHVTRRSPVVKKIERRSPAVLEALWPTGRRAGASRPLLPS
jgi:hypothetical protein